MINRNGETWLTIDEATEAADRSRRTIYNWIAANKVIIMRNASGRIYIKENSLFKDNIVLESGRYKDLTS